MYRGKATDEFAEALRFEYLQKSTPVITGKPLPRLLHQQQRLDDADAWNGTSNTPRPALPAKESRASDCHPAEEANISPEWKEVYEIKRRLEKSSDAFAMPLLELLHHFENKIAK